MNFRIPNLFKNIAQHVFHNKERKETQITEDIIQKNKTHGGNQSWRKVNKKKVNKLKTDPRGIRIMKRPYSWV